MKFHKAPTTFVSKVVLKVENIERSIQFYEQVIGFQLLDRTEGKARFTADGENVLLEVEQPDDVVGKTGRTAGLYHFALLVPNRSDLADVVRHFTEIGLQFGAGDHYVSEAIYLSDPDGNGIEIYADRDEKEWNWRDAEVDMGTEAVNFQELMSTESEEGWRGMQAQTVMGHIHLQVGNLDDNEAFYVDALGFQIVNRYGESVLFISDNDYHHHIAFNTWAGVGILNASANTVGLKSYSIIFPTKEKREAIIAKLKQIGASVEEKDGVFITYDPSDIRIDLEIGEQ